MPFSAASTERNASEVNSAQPLYLNECGKNISKIFNAGINYNDIFVEVPSFANGEVNIETQTFNTYAKSEITTKGNLEFTAELVDFRKLRITGPSGKVLINRKVSGYTSIFELRQNDVPIGWAVGWHQHCKKYYQHADFTALRLYIPNSEGELSERLFSANPSWLSASLSDSNNYIFIASRTIIGPYGASDFHYGAIHPYWITAEGKITEVNSLAMLQKLAPEFAEDFAEKYPLKYLYWLSYTPFIQTAQPYQKHTTERAYDKELMSKTQKQYKQFLKSNINRILVRGFQVFGDKGITHYGLPMEYEELIWEENAQETMLRYFKDCQIKDFDTPRAIADKCLPKFGAAIAY